MFLSPTHWFCLLTLSLFGLSAHAQWSGPEHDVKSFELSGVQLGMSSSEVQDALTQYHNIEIEDLEVSTIQNRFRIRGQSLPYPGSRVDKIKYQMDDAIVIVEFTRLKPKRSNVAHYITYTRNNTEPSDLVLEQATLKYGEPTGILIYMTPHAYIWCSKKSASAITPCDNNEPRLEIYKDRIYILTLAKR